MKRLGSYCSLFWLFFSLLICREAFRLKLGVLTKPGPGFFPFSLGLVMGILALIALYQSMGKRREEGEKSEPKGSLRWWNIVIILAALVAYAFFLETIGFLISTFLLITLLLKVVEPQRWSTALVGGLITALASTLVFNVLLRAQIPTGFLGF